MPAHSFGIEWLNPLLRGDKRGTTRPQHTRVKVGDIVSIYNQQRRRIIDKPEIRLTDAGIEMMISRYGMTKRQKLLGVFPAHFLGKVEITEVYDIHPCEMTEDELKVWAQEDGFECFDPNILTIESINTSANWWFSERYGNEWMGRWWTVERWDGWLERYFEPEAI